MKTGLIALEVCAVLIAIFAGACAFLFWRLDQGPVPFGLFKPSIAFAIERRLPEGHSTEIEHVSLARGPDGRNLVFAIEEISVLRPDGGTAASAPMVAFTFASADLLRGKTGPRTITITSPALRIIRDERQNLEVDAFGGEGPRIGARLNRILSSGNIVQSAFRSASLTGAKIDFVDVASGRTWSSDGGQIDIQNTPEGFSFVAEGDILIGDVASKINADADYTQESGVISANISGENMPVSDILSMFYGDQAAIVEAPVSGKASVAISAEGDVLSSRINARVGEGKLRLGETETSISNIQWDAAFDPQRNIFDVEKFAFDVNGSSGVITGNVAVDFADDVRSPSHIRLDLTGETLVANLPGFLPEPLPVEALNLSGAYDIDDRRLRISGLKADLLDIVISGDLGFERPRGADGEVAPSLGVAADIKIDGALDPQRLLRLWPIPAANGARDWVEDRLDAAVIENVLAKIDLAPGVVGPDGRLPDEAMTVTFDVSEATARYAPLMTPLTNASGSGLLRGNSFLLKADKGMVGDVAISQGEVEFPEFIPKWQPTYIRFRANGASEDILSVLDQRPLQLLSKINLAPDQFVGAATANVEIMRPNKRNVRSEEYRYSGKATFEDMVVTGLMGDVELEGAHGEVDLRARSLTVTADASLSEAPINIVWRQNFFERDGPSSIDVAGVIDSTTGDLFGVSAREYLRGPIPFEAKAIGEIGDLESIAVNADLTGATLALPQVGWEKPADAAAKGEIDIRFAEDVVSIDELRIIADDAEINGAIAFSNEGALQSASFEEFQLAGAADLTLSAERTAKGELKLTAIGQYLNAGPMIEQTLRGSQGREETSDEERWGAGLIANARIDRVALREGVEHSAAALDLWRSAEGLESLTYTALDHEGPPLTVTMGHSGEEESAGRSIEARSNNIGSLLAGIFAVTSVRGGEGEMVIDLGAPDTRGFSGVLNASNLRVIEAPLLAKIFAAGSLTGLGDLLTNEGIELDDAYGEFRFEDGALILPVARATGPSLGITGEGDATLGAQGAININGAVAPLYQVNSILGAAPIIGDILVGKEGEGMFALSYQVSGETAAPSVSVNPLSALTPGIFRNLFEQPTTAGRETSDADEEGAAAEEPSPAPN